MDEDLTFAPATKLLELISTKQVSPVELTQLFEWLKWEQPPSFLQTLRNTSRSNYRWMQNVPGGSGYYVVTERGRQTVIQHAPN